MTQLIKKELILQKKMLWFGVGYSIFLFIAFANPVFQSFTYSMCAFGIAYTLILGIAQAEYKNNTDIIINSLPVNRQEIVAAKYIAIVIGTFFALVIVSVVGLIFHQLPAPFNLRLINLLDVVTALISVTILAAVSMPVYFKTTAQWIRIVNVLFFMLIFFAPAQIVGYLMKNGHQDWLQKVSQTAYDQIWLLSLGMAAVMAVSLLVSYYISLRIYQNKDF
jgi:ABC-type transport system involved in multi-copper enzyme maturation permease subunit